MHHRHLCEYVLICVCPCVDVPYMSPLAVLVQYKKIDGHIILFNDIHCFQVITSFFFLSDFEARREETKIDAGESGVCSPAKHATRGQTATGQKITRVG